MFAHRSGGRRWGAASVLLTVLIGGLVIGLTREPAYFPENLGQCLLLLGQAVC